MFGLIFPCLTRFPFFLRGVPVEVILTGNYLAKAFDLVQKHKPKQHREVQGRCEEMSHKMPAQGKKAAVTEIRLGAGGLILGDLGMQTQSHFVEKAALVVSAS